MTGNPFILAGLIVVVVAIVIGIVGAILKSRADSQSMPFSKLSIEPVEDPATEPADLSKLDALLATPAPVEHTPPETEAEPEPYPSLIPDPESPAAVAAAEELAMPDVVDSPDRDEEPLPGMWAHLVATEEGPLGVEDRVDMVARLEMVAEKWCVDALQSAVDEEKDPQVNAAVRAALARLR